MGKIVDINGQNFGRLTVIKFVELKRIGKWPVAIWECVCICGNRIQVQGRGLRSGNTQSCGCLQRERTGNSNRTHGCSDKYSEFIREYRSWQDMKKRCYNPKNKQYKDYGGRGIKVCEEWENNFEKFLSDMGRCPQSFTLDRIDVNGNYSKYNCRWLSKKMQNRNRRNNRLINVNGTIMTLAELAEKSQRWHGTVRNMLARGEPVENILNNIK